VGIAERKEREKQQLRALIIEAATKLFLEKGFEKTSIRTIANEIEYSPATIYLHFADKNELFYEIAEKAFAHFYGYLKEAESVTPPTEKLRAMGLNYIRFAFEHPGYYNLMFIIEAPMLSHHNDAEWKSGDHALGYLVSTVKECQADGYFAGKDSFLTATMIWSFMHGIVSLKLRGRMKGIPEEQATGMIYETFSIFNSILNLDKKI